MKIAIACNVERQRDKLAGLLADRGFEVVFGGEMDASLFNTLVQLQIDALLIDMAGDDVLHNDVLDVLLDRLNVPILFNDGEELSDIAKSDQEFATFLANKLLSVCSKRAKAIQPRAIQEEAVAVDGRVTNEEQQQSSTKTSVAQNIITPPAAQTVGNPAEQVWVLAGSMGGLDGVRRFLGLIPADLPVTFVLALHIGAENIGLLADLIAKSTPFRVMPARSGHLLAQQQVIIAPVDQCLAINGKGILELQLPVPDIGLIPTIDNIMRMIARRYKHQAGAIVFSGIGSDSVIGCQAIVSQGGEVWTQEAGSCLFDSLPRYVGEACEVSCTAEPELLAAHLVDQFKKILPQQVRKIS